MILPTGIVPRQGEILWEHDNGMDLKWARQLVGSGKMLLMKLPCQGCLVWFLLAVVKKGCHGGMEAKSGWDGLDDEGCIMSN